MPTNNPKGIPPAPSGLSVRAGSASSIVTPELLRISREVHEENGAAEQLLRAKCRWEQRTRTAIIRAYGDPRNWQEKTVVRTRADRPWSEYPVGTKAPAIMGGHWYRNERGWKWNGPDGSGGTFPTPGGDNNGTVIFPQNVSDEPQLGSEKLNK